MLAAQSTGRFGGVGIAAQAGATPSRSRRAAIAASAVREQLVNAMAPRSKLYGQAKTLLAQSRRGRASNAATNDTRDPTQSGSKRSENELQ